MKTGWLSSERFMLCIVASMLLLSILVLVLNNNRRGGVDLTERLREVRASKTRAAVALSVLRESDQLELIQADTPDSVESLKLAIIEALSSDVLNGLLNIKSSSVQETDRASWHNDKSEKPLHSLSVAINAVAREADVLLTVLRRLQAAAQWRPVELRSCSFKRQDRIDAVAFTCMIDIYIFPANNQGLNK